MKTPKTLARLQTLALLLVVVSSTGAMARQCIRARNPATTTISWYQPVDILATDQSGRQQPESDPIGFSIYLHFLGNARKVDRLQNDGLSCVDPTNGELLTALVTFGAGPPCQAVEPMRLNMDWPLITGNSPKISCRPLVAMDARVLTPRLYFFKKAGVVSHDAFRLGSTLTIPKSLGGELGLYFVVSNAGSTAPMWAFLRSAQMQGIWPDGSTWTIPPDVVQPNLAPFPVPSLVITPSERWEYHVSMSPNGYVQFRADGVRLP